MYVTAQNGVYALDAQTGTQLWKFESDGGTRRGLTYWPRRRQDAGADLRIRRRSV